MSLNPSTRFIKTGQSKNPFLLFLGNRKTRENKLDEPISGFMTSLLFAIVFAALCICIYGFIWGKLG